MESRKVCFEAHLEKRAGGISLGWGLDWFQKMGGVHPRNQPWFLEAISAILYRNEEKEPASRESGRNRWRNPNRLVGFESVGSLQVVLMKYGYLALSFLSLPKYLLQVFESLNTSWEGKLWGVQTSPPSRCLCAISVSVGWKLSGRFPELFGLGSPSKTSKEDTEAIWVGSVLHIFWVVGGSSQLGYLLREEGAIQANRKRGFYWSMCQ